MKVTQASTYRTLQTNLNRNTAKLQDLYYQGSTGLKLNKASDNPSVIQPVLSARNQITLSERYINTLGESSDKMASTDTSLATMENIYQRASEISINAVNSVLTEQDLATLADEVAELKDQMLDVANAQIDGKFLFAGYSVTATPFTENPHYDPALYDEADNTTWPVIYNGDSNRTTLEIGEGEYLDVNLTGNELFWGIENSEEQAGSTGLTGATIESSKALDPNWPGEITIKNGDTTITIPESFRTDTTSDNNYLAKLSSLIVDGPTNLGDIETALGDYASPDSYTLHITAGTGAPVSVTLDSTSGYPFTNEEMATALGNLSGSTVIDSNSGTLANGVQYDISSGELLLTHEETGTAITFTESTGAQPTGLLPAVVNDSQLKTTINPATVDLGDFSSSTATDYSLDITSESGTVPTIFTTDVSLTGIATALGNQLPTPDPDATSGTFSNGVSYDISSGSLVITGEENGANLELTETASPSAPTITVTYGTIDVSTDTTQEVSISGEGLTGAGLTAGTLIGSVTVDIFGVLTRLEEALNAGNLDDPEGVGGGVQEAIAKLDLAADQNRRKRSQLGVKASRVEDEINQQEATLIDIRTTLSRYEDADITETYNDILQQEAAYQAALTVTGRVSQISILDYL